MSPILLLCAVCAVLASLTFGVLVAYGLCQGMFVMFRVHSRQVAERRMGLVGAAGVTGEQAAR